LFTGRGRAQTAERELALSKRIVSVFSLFMLSFDGVIGVSAVYVFISLARGCLC
jgi:hypothetical protein